MSIKFFKNIQILGQNKYFFLPKYGGNCLLAKIIMRTHGAVPFLIKIIKNKIITFVFDGY